MKTKSGTISQIATCSTCEKQWENYIKHNARKSAYRHAKTTGHTVIVETTTFIKYN